MNPQSFIEYIFLLLFLHQLPVVDFSGLAQHLVSCGKCMSYYCQHSHILSQLQMMLGPVVVELLRNCHRCYVAFIGVPDWQAGCRNSHQLPCTAALQVPHTSEMSGGGKMLELSSNKRIFISCPKTRVTKHRSFTLTNNVYSSSIKILPVRCLADTVLMAPYFRGVYQFYVMPHGLYVFGIVWKAMNLSSIFW